MNKKYLGKIGFSTLLLMMSTASQATPTDIEQPSFVQEVYEWISRYTWVIPNPSVPSTQSDKEG